MNGKGKSGSVRELLAKVAVLAAPLLVAGCLHGADSGGSPVALAADAAQGGTWGPGAGAAGSPPIPALEELESALALSAEQKVVVGEALADWRRAAADRGGQGRRGAGGACGAGEGGPGAPLLAFLEKTVPVLEPAQVEALAGSIRSKEPPHRPGRGAERERRGDRGPRGPGHHGPGAGERGPGGPGGGFLAEVLGDLDLSEAQRTRVREVVSEGARAFHELHRAFADGAIPAEQLRDDARQLREGVESSLRSILDDEQEAALEAAVTEHREEVTGRRLECLEADVERQLDFLARVLALGEEQAAQARSVVTATVPERRAVLESLREGTIEIEEALYRGHRISEEAGSALRSVLTAEQVTVLDALERLVPGRRGPLGRGR